MEVLEYLKQFAPPGKIELFDELIEDRTNHLTVVLEDIFQPHNASACVRSCDCFGVQNAHIIENIHEYEMNPDILVGSAKWVNMEHYNTKKQNTKDCLDKLKKDGYKIVATTPLPNTKTIYDFPLDEKIALVFGNEKDGISDIVKEEADGFVTIPMYGFTESFNISVSVALCVYEFTKRLHNSDIDWKLSKKEKEESLLYRVRNSIKNSAWIEKEFLKNRLIK